MPTLVSPDHTCMAEELKAADEDIVISQARSVAILVFKTCSDQIGNRYRMGS